MRLQCHDNILNVIYVHKSLQFLIHDNIENIEVSLCIFLAEAFVMFAENFVPARRIKVHREPKRLSPPSIKSTFTTARLPPYETSTFSTPSAKMLNKARRRRIAGENWSS